MQSGKILDAQITASSEFDVKHAPRQARLHFISDLFINGKAGAWSTKKTITGDWIQVDFYSLKVLTAVATQGRYDRSQWVTSYSLAYSNNGNSFTPYQGGKVFPGNSDQNSVVKHTLNPSITTRYIRLYVKGFSGHPSLRMEYYGCE